MPSGRLGPVPQRAGSAAVHGAGGLFRAELLRSHRRGDASLRGRRAGTGTDCGASSVRPNGQLLHPDSFRGGSAGDGNVPDVAGAASRSGGHRWLRKRRRPSPSAGARGCGAWEPGAPVSGTGPALGGVRRLPGEILRSLASSTPAPQARVSRVATDNTRQCRETRARVGPAGLIPFPAQALDRLEAQFDPEAERVPTHPDRFRRKVGEDDPWFLLISVPDRQQGATAFGGGEGGTAADPRVSGDGKRRLARAAGGRPGRRRCCFSDTSTV